MLRKLRNAVVCVYLIVVVGIGGGVYLWLRDNWINERDSAGEGLVADASLVSNFIQANLIDASKLLDLARIRIRDGFERRPLVPKAIHEIIDTTLESISFSVSQDLRGLLFFIDANGKMVAQSGAFPAPPIDFSDRLYYRKVVGDPSVKVAVGNFVKARTTGKIVFHVSMPVRSMTGKLYGVLVQQIRVHDIAETIKNSIKIKDAIITCHVSGDEIVFVYPEGSKPLVGLESHKESGREKGWLLTETQSGQGAEEIFLGYALAPIFGLYTSAAVSERTIVERFFHRQEPLLAASAVALLFVTVLFYALVHLIKDLENEIELSNRDALTGLRNRRFFDSIYDSYCRESIRNKTFLGVLFLDIDNFKQLNDAYGHLAGDSILKSIARVLLENVRRPLDICCRWGGEEFVVLLPDTDIDGTVALAKDIQAHLSNPSIYDDATISTVTVSIGALSRIVTPENIKDDLVGLADKAMLRAKAEGRNRIVIHEE